MALNPGLLPNESAPIADGRLLATQEWRDFFLRLADGAETAELADEYASLAERVTELEQSGSSLGTILGVGSVSAIGDIGDVVRVSLKNDQNAPAAGQYYGTDDNGVLGYWPTPDDSMLPIVTGEIVSGQPVFVIGPNGSLIYGPVI